MANGKLEARAIVPTGGWAFDITETPSASATITVPAFEYYHSSGGTSTSLVAKIQSALTAATAGPLAATYTISCDAGEGGTGKYTITATGGSVTSFAITWTDTELRDLLGWSTSPSGALTYTSEGQAQGLWLPEYGFQCVGGGSFPGRIVSDQQIAMASSGATFSVMGRKYREKSITWPMEPVAKVLTVQETTVNASFETFLIDGIYGEASWGTSAGPIRFYEDADVNGTHLTYYAHGFETWDPHELREHWSGGLYGVTLPKLIQVPA